jgi:hypothetical protein
MSQRRRLVPPGALNRRHDQVLTSTREAGPEPQPSPQVEAAIALVAGGRFARVEVAGVPDARAVLARLRLPAARRGVMLVLDLADDGHPIGIVAQRA